MGCGNHNVFLTLNVKIFSAMSPLSKYRGVLALGFIDQQQQAKLEKGGANVSEGSPKYISLWDLLHLHTLKNVRYFLSYMYSQKESTKTIFWSTLLVCWHINKRCHFKEYYVHTMIYMHFAKGHKKLKKYHFGKW